jgi:hypothetical protein
MGSRQRPRTRQTPNLLTQPHTLSTTQHSPKRKGQRTHTKRKSQPPAHPYGDRKPQDPCGYCGGANHTARTCYKRQNDEKTEKNKPHKQANLNIQIDEQTLMFKQSVLSVSQSDTESDNDTTVGGVLCQYSRDNDQ